MNIPGTLQRVLETPQHFVVSQDDVPDDQRIRFNSTLLGLLEWDEQFFEHDEDLRRYSKRTTKRQQDKMRLPRFVTSNVRMGLTQKRYCPFGCCPGDAAESIRRLYSYIMSFFISHLPPVRALNRWTKLYPAISWFVVMLHWHGLIQVLWGLINGLDDAVNLGTVFQDLIFLEDEEVIRKLNTHPHPQKENTSIPPPSHPHPHTPPQTPPSRINSHESPTHTPTETPQSTYVHVMNPVRVLNAVCKCYHGHARMLANIRLRMRARICIHDCGPMSQNEHSCNIVKQ